MLVIVYFTPLVLFFHQTAATTAFTSTPSPNPSTVKERHDITLVWNYTLDGNVLLARFANVTGGVDDEIARKTVQDGTISMKSNYLDRFSAGISDTQAWLKILKVQRSDQGNYEFAVTGTSSGSIKHVVEVIVQYEPSVTIQHCSTPVTEGKNVTLSCSATGSPVPSFAWIRTSTREVLSNYKMHVIAAINWNESGSYECLASNDVGNNTKSCTIDVQYQPKILKLPSVYNVTAQQSVTLICQAEGNPTPSFAWTPCKDGCDERMLVIPEVLNDTVYTCTVTNDLGSDSATASVVIADKEINVTLTITGKSCTNKTLLSNKLTKEIDKVFVNESAYISTTLKDVRCGSLIVDLSLKFNSIVREKWVLNILKEATKDGKLGEFNVAASSIKGTRPVISTTTSPTGKTTSGSPGGETNIGLIVGCAVGGFIALVVIIAVIIWCVRKNSNKDKDKKKKSKTSNKEVSDNDAEGHRMAQFQGSHPTPGYGNNGYEDTGSTSRPPVANAGKKDKKGKKKQEQEPEKPVGVVYAQVDKSKRTSKPKEPENLYDQAERPNSKRPGELNYASPEDLHQGHSMPRNSAAQPKKPEAYTETQYAVLV